MIEQDDWPAVDRDCAAACSHTWFRVLLHHELQGESLTIRTGEHPNAAVLKAAMVEGRRQLAREILRRAENPTPPRRD